MLLLPLEGQVKVAFRIHDVVHLYDRLPPGSFESVLVRLMVMVNLQGVIKVFIGGKEHKLRVGFKAGKHGLSALLEIPQDGSIVDTCKAQAAKLGYPYVCRKRLRFPAR